MLDEAVSLDDVERGERGGAAGGLPTVSGGDRHAGDGIAKAFAYRDGGDRIPVPEELAEDDDVGDHALVVTRPPRSRTAQPGGVLVEDQQCLVAIRDLAKAAQKAGSIDAGAAAIGHRLCDDRRHRAVAVGAESPLGETYAVQPAGLRLQTELAAVTPAARHGHEAAWPRPG